MVTVPYDLLEETEDKKEEDPLEEETSQNPFAQVTLYAHDLQRMPKVIKRACRKYQIQYENATQQKLIPYDPKVLRLEEAGERILDLRNDIKGFLKGNGFKIKSSRNIPMMEATKITFNDDLNQIIKVEANLFGCNGVEFNTTNPGKGWDKLVEADSARNTTTNAFFVRLPDMFNDVTARKPITVEKFLNKYWYPPLNLENSEELTLLMNQDLNKTCNWKNFKPTEPLVSIGNEVLTQIQSFPELFLNEVIQNTCYTLEGKSVIDKKILDLDSVQKRWKDADKRKSFVGDGAFAECIRSLEKDKATRDKDGQITGSEPKTTQELYSECVDKLGWCGILALLYEATGCIMKGLDLGTSMKTILKSFIQNATESELETLFFKLHPELQIALKEAALKISDMPLPWEAGYRPGSYTGPGMTIDTQYGEYGSGVAKGYGGAPGWSRNTSVDVETIKEFKESTYGTESRVLSGSHPAPGLGPRRYGGALTAGAGTIGTILDEAIFDPLVKAFLQLLEDEILSVDVLMDAINNMPGGAVIMKALSDLAECPPPPLFSPPLDDIFKSAEIDICKGHYSLTLPVWNKFKVGTLWSNFKDIMIESAENTVDNFVMRIIMMVMGKIINWIINAPCEVLADSAAIIKEVAGGCSLKEALAKQLCPETPGGGTPADVAPAITALFDQWGAWDPNCDVTPTETAVDEFMNGVAGILTADEAYGLISGNPSEQALKYVADVVAVSDPSIQCAFPTADSIASALNTVGQMVDLDEVEQDLQSDLSPGSPLCPSICDDTEAKEIFDQARDDALNEKGCGEEERNRQHQLLRDIAKKDLEDLSNVMNGAIFDSIPPFVSPDPRCPEKGILPAVDESTLQAGSEVTQGIYENLTMLFMRELIARRGLLNMILSDINGRGYKRHTEWYVNIWGESLSSEMGGIFDFFEWFVDENDDPSKKKSGAFPETVALTLKTQLDDMSTDEEKTYQFDGGSFDDGQDNLKMEYDNWEEPKTVNLYYNHYVVASNGSLVGNNTFSIRGEQEIDSLLTGKTNLVPTFNIVGERSIPNDVMTYVEENLKTPLGYLNLADAAASGALYINEGDEQHASSLEFHPNNISGTPKSSPQSLIFGTLLESTWNKYNGESFVFPWNIMREETFNYLTSAMLKKFTSKIADNARAFKFGFDSSLHPKQVPLPWEAYGGTEENPPFYIERPQYGGWLGLYEKIAPHPDGCDNEPLINFKEVADIVDNYSREFKDDPRLQAPNPACLIEPVYDRILPAAAAAGIEGMIRATCRLYVVEAMIKGMPVFSLFATKYPEMFDETLFSYLSEKMQNGLLEVSRNIWGRLDLTKEIYYYTFLEQVVQSFDRKIKLGEVVATNVEQAALDRIRAYQSTWVEPSKCSNLDNIPWPKRRKAIKACRQAKRDLFVKYMTHTQHDALIILNRYLSEELTAVAKTFNQALTPAVADMPNLILASPDWMSAGAVSQGGPLDVPRDATDPNDPSVQAILQSTQPGHDLGPDQLVAFDGYFPFVLEKYIKIENYNADEEPVLGSGQITERDILGAEFPRGPKLQTIVNMDAWKAFLTNYDWAGLPIGSLYKKWSFGLRISFKMPAKFNKVISSEKSAFDTTTRLTHQSLMLPGVITTAHPDGIPVYILPIISAEIPIDPTKIIHPAILDQYNLNDLVCELIQTTPYKTLFNYCFPLPGLLSLVTIYTMETFLLAIGEEWGDNSAQTGGEQGGRNGSQFRRWDPEELFKRTKKTLRRAFQSYYYSTDSEYKDPDEESRSYKDRKKLSVKKKFPKNIDIKRRQRKMERPKPPEECK